MSVAIEKVSNVKAHTQYRVDGKRVPGVTTVLQILNKPALVPWANQLGLQGVDVKKYVDQLATIGTLGHYLIECEIKGVKPDLTPYSAEEINLAENCLLKFYDWTKEHDVEFLKSELQLISKKYLFGGTIDCLARVEGKLTLLDFKTSKAIYPEMVHQLSAYHQLAKENGYTEIKSVRILRIGRTDAEGFEEQVYKISNLANHWKIFKACLEIYNLKKLVS